MTFTQETWYVSQEAESPTWKESAIEIPTPEQFEKAEVWAALGLKHTPDATPLQALFSLTVCTLRLMRPDVEEWGEAEIRQKKVEAVMHSAR